MGSSNSTPAPQPITATEASVKTINRTNHYPAIFNLILDYNEDGSGLTWPTTIFISAVTIALVVLVVVLYKKVRACHQAKKIKEATELQEVLGGSEYQYRVTNL